VLANHRHSMHLFRQHVTQIAEYMGPRRVGRAAAPQRGTADRARDDGAGLGDQR
jgi:hypothetical protein